MLLVVNDSQTLLTDFFSYKNLAVFLPIVLHNNEMQLAPLHPYPFHLFSEKISDAVLQKKVFAGGLLLLLLLR